MCKANNSKFKKAKNKEIQSKKKYNQKQKSKNMKARKLLIKGYIANTIRIC